MSKNSNFMTWAFRPLGDSWVMMRATPCHESVVCMSCWVTPAEEPGVGWHRQGTNPETWQHLCPICVWVCASIGEESEE
jgi:hypothetical protein